MSLSMIFWLDTLVNLITGVIALALLVPVLGVGLRQRLNQSFGLFIASAALLGLSAGVANISLALDTRALADRGGFGNPLLCMELAALGFYMAGPALFLFSIIYVETWKHSGEASEAGQASKGPTNRGHKALAALGFLVGLAAIPALLDHQIINRFSLDAADFASWEVAPVGYVFIAIPFCLELLALRLFLENRHISGATAAAISTAILLTGAFMGAIASIPFPVVSISFATGFIVMGYIVTRRQIFQPLQDTTKHLEETVAERIRELQQTKDKLQRLNSQQRRVAEINREVARAATPTDMITRLVRLIHDHLGYHHVYLYLPDETNQQLIVRAAAGTTAQTVLDRGHQVQIGGRTLIGQAAAQSRPRLAEARGEDVVYFSDTALASARSELAIPLLAGGNLLGVLDLQSIYYQDLTDDDVKLMTSLADQCATTLHNARLLQKTQAALAEVEKAQQQYLQQTWGAVVSKSRAAPAYVYTGSDDVTPANLDDVLSPEIAQAAAKAQPSVHTVSEQAGDGGLTTQSQILAVPITLRGQVIGALRLRHKIGRTWQPEDIEVLRNVADRLALALDNTRLQEETRRRATRDRLVSEIAGQVRGSLDPDTILKTTVRELGRALGVRQAAVELTGPQKDDDSFYMQESL
jgi:GAF domain-containing protein